MTQDIEKTSKLKENNQMPVSVALIIFILAAYYFAVVIFHEEEGIKEVEVCEGVRIATINANPDLCFYGGCVQYKGEFVPYNTLKYLREKVCNQSK